MSVTDTPHLVRRFFRSMFARPLDAEEHAWVASVLTPAELALWERFRRDDQRHTYEVAREVERLLGDTPERSGPWMAAALLHDIGKVETELGLVGRAVATVIGGAIGRPRVAGWAGRAGWRGRMGRYIDHPRIGARLVRDAGGREAVARWAELHHDGRVRAGGSVPDVPDRAIRALIVADTD